MNQPELYARANKVQRQDAKTIVAEFEDKLELSENGKDSLLDIGCGSGDVLMDFIYPILPDNFRKVIGIDIAPQMIEYAKKTYASYNKVDFKVLDIETEHLPLQYHEQFDLITSFYTLQWIQNQRKSVQNIYKMLRNNGNILLVFLGTDGTFDTFKPLSKDPRFSAYMKDVDSYVPPFQNNHNIKSEYIEFLEEAGFVDLQVELRKLDFFYDGAEIYKDNMRAVNPFINRMPIYKQEEYMDAMFELWQSKGLCEKMKNENDYVVSKPYTLLVVYARKN